MYFNQLTIVGRMQRDHFQHVRENRRQHGDRQRHHRRRVDLLQLHRQNELSQS